MQSISIAALKGAALGALLLASHPTCADNFPKSDQAKIADALRAAPVFITKDASVLDWPAKPGERYRVLRKGTSEWSCLPGVPFYAHDEPGCFDATFLDWLTQSIDGKLPKVDRVGVAYMYVGAWVPDLMHDGDLPDHTFHVGPHIMIVTPHDEDLQNFNRDGSNGQIYVAHLPNRKGLYLVMPIREWGAKAATRSAQ